MVHLFTYFGITLEKAETLFFKKNHIKSELVYFLGCEPDLGKLKLYLFKNIFSIQKTFFNLFLNFKNKNKNFKSVKFISLEIRELTYRAYSGNK